MTLPGVWGPILPLPAPHTPMAPHKPFLPSWPHPIPLHSLWDLILLLLQLLSALNLFQVPHSHQKWGELGPPHTGVGLGMQGAPNSSPEQAPPLLNPTALIAKPCQMSGPCTSLCPLPALPLAWGGPPRLLGCLCAPTTLPQIRHWPCKRLHIFHMYKKSLRGDGQGGPGVGGHHPAPLPVPPQPGFGPFFFGT